MAETTGTPTTAPKKRKSVSDRIRTGLQERAAGAETDKLNKLVSERDAFVKAQTEGVQRGHAGSQYQLTHHTPILDREIAKQRKAVSDPISGRDAEVLKGAEFAESVLGDEGLGRLGDDAEISAAMDRTKRESEQGLSAEEYTAQRSKAFEGIDRSTQTSLRGIQARLARSGVKGATGGKQLIDAEMQGASQKAGIERDLFLEDANVKRSSFKDYKQSLGSIKTFDIGQQKAETDIILQSGLTYGQINSSEKIAKLQADMANASAAARASANSCWMAGTMIVMKNGGIKAIEQLRLGEETKYGKVEGKTQHLVPSEVMVSIDGIKVVGSHPIFEVDTWIESKDSALATNLDGDMNNDLVVYDIIVPENRVAIYSNGHEYLFTDYNGHDMTEENDRLLEELNNVEGISKREVR